ncbi:MAG: glycosyltransferase [Rhodobacteraceae bacterium]|nr:MAG: glycosyltransferase [Paracoccaceae bacterium]
MPLVLVRTPTYRRPDQLRRAIGCLQAQSHQDWICEIRDDCPDSSARAVVEEIGDPRLRYIANRPQKFMVRNLDDCYLRDNPYGADYFFMLEDDNQVLPDFMARGIEILTQMGLTICQINQRVAYASTGQVSDFGIFDETFDARVYQPEELRLACFGRIGISNGAVFWSRNLQRELAFKVDTLPTLEEYLRLWLLADPVYICREPLALWTKDEAVTTRNLGLGKGRLKRELDLKASLHQFRRHIWQATPEPLQTAFLAGGVLRIPMADRLDALERAGIATPGHVVTRGLTHRMKQWAVRNIGTVHPSVGAVIAATAPT